MLKRQKQRNTNTPTHIFLFVGLIFCRFSSPNWLIETSDKTRVCSRKQRENMARDKERRGNRRAELPLRVTTSHWTGFAFLSDHMLLMAARIKIPPCLWWSNFKFLYPSSKCAADTNGGSALQPTPRSVFLLLSFLPAQTSLWLCCELKWETNTAEK